MVFVSETIATYFPVPAHPHVSAVSLAVVFAVGLVSWLVLAEEADLRREQGPRS